jgi:hypothetical protein
MAVVQLPFVLSNDFTQDLQRLFASIGESRLVLNPLAFHVWRVFVDIIMRARNKVVTVMHILLATLINGITGSTMR